MQTRPSWLTTSRALALAIAAYALLVALFEATNLDLWTEDHFYDFTARQWLVDRGAPLPKLIFYNAPKFGLIAFGLYLLAVAVGLKPSRNWTRRDALYLLGCMAAVPIAVAIGKKLTGVCCPWELARYGGAHEHRTLLGSLRAAHDCQCYPAGHASGGFGLLALAFAGRRRTLSIGLAAGWTMGLYQMLRGAHFLSHTIGSMMLGLILTLALAILFNIPDVRESESWPH